jgi:transposase
LRFEQWCAEYREVDKMYRRLMRVVRSQFDQLWPNALVNVKRFQKAHPNLEPPEPLVKTSPLKRQFVQVILTHCPNPHDVRIFTEDEMVELLYEHSGRREVEKARRVLRVAYNGVLPPPDVAQILAERLSHDWKICQLYIERLEVLKAQANDLVPHSPAAVLPSIPGVSNYLAARYLAGIRDITRFDEPRQIWAFAGFDPNLDASGDARRIGKISKRGDPAFRETLYLIGAKMAQHCPDIKPVYARAHARYSGEGRHVASVIHAANAANRMIFRLLVEQRPYLPVAPRPRFL